MIKCFDVMQKLIELYRQWHGSEPVSTEKLPQAGSNREYYRMTGDDGSSVIGAIGTSRDENHAFIYLSGHFRKRQLPVPRILSVSDDELRYLQEDLGRVSLFSAISGGREAGGRYNQKEKQLLINTIKELPNIQIRGARGLDWSNCYPQPEFDENSVLFDLNYFKYCFLKPAELDSTSLSLKPTSGFCKDLVAEKTDSFMYRDFQARNIMLDASGRPYFIDYQGGRKGPFYYDLASFLWQASAKYPHKLRRELIYEYYNSLKIIPKCLLSDTLPSALACSCFSVRFRCLVHTASEDSLSARSISLTAYRQQCRTCANCLSLTCLHIHILWMC